jgi:hypothetical protein
MILTQKQLNRANCEIPDCDHTNDDPFIYLHSRCHPDSGLNVNYNKLTGLLSFHCETCEKQVAQIRVAE